MMCFHEKLQNASKIKDSHFNIFDDFSGLSLHTKLGLTILEMVIHGVSFRTVFFENVPESKLLDNLTTEYDFFMAKSWNF